MRRLFARFRAMCLLRRSLGENRCRVKDRSRWPCRESNLGGDSGFQSCGAGVASLQHGYEGQTSGLALVRALRRGAPLPGACLLRGGRQLPAPPHRRTGNGLPRLPVPARPGPGRIERPSPGCSRTRGLAGSGGSRRFRAESSFAPSRRPRSSLGLASFQNTRFRASAVRPASQRAARRRLFARL